MWFGRTVSEKALRPVRWPGRPGGSSLLRVGLVAVLLGLAAAVLHTPPTCSPPTLPPAQRPAGGLEATATGPATTGPATTGPGGQSSGRPPSGEGGDDRPGGRLPLPDSRLPLPDGTVGVPVRLAEPAALAVVRPGSRVDLLAVPAGSPAPALIAPRALVLDVVGVEAPDVSSALYLALSPAQAQRVVGLPEGSRFAVLVRG